MSGRRGATALKNSARKTSNKDGEEQAQCECPICLEVIVDPPNENHQPSIFCEGVCKSWLHKSCAGLTEQAFQYFARSKTPYQCLHCTVKQQKAEIAQLKQMLVALSGEVSQLLKGTRQTSNPVNHAAQSPTAPAAGTGVTGHSIPRAFGFGGVERWNGILDWNT